MIKLTNVIVIIFTVFNCIYSVQNSCESIISSNFPGLENFLLPCWKATCIQHPDSSRIPVNSDRKSIAPPLFNIFFEDTCHLVPRYEGLSNEVQPNLMLCFYPISQKTALTRIIDESVVFSWCIPIAYDETNTYFIITSPCFRNNGNMNDEVRNYFEPQNSALHVYFSTMENTSKTIGYGSNYHKRINSSNMNAAQQFFINGRVKTGGHAYLPTIGLSEKGVRRNLQVPLK